MVESDAKNVAIAFGLVIGAGSATAIGASVVFFPRLVKFANRKTLAGALGLSAGVMTYVSFVEIFQKSLTSFEDAGFDEKFSYMYATVCFFGGVILMVALNYVVTRLLRGEHHHHHDPVDLRNRQDGHTRSTNTLSDSTPQPTKQDDDDNDGGDDETDVVPCPCCAEDPAKNLENVRHMAEVMEQKEEETEELKQQEEDDDDDERIQHSHVHNEHCMHDADGDEGEEEEEEDEDEEKGESDSHHDDAKLMRMSVNTAIAIALHNFPEGLATFVAALNDPKVGLVLAVAIAIHNVPEGLCVAMPVYYATGKRWKAFAWGVLSGVSEPIAALLGWAVLAKTFSNTLYAVLFGLVGGMMVIISARELLPTAHRYDPEDSVVTYCFIGGMFIMALSLVLFLL